MISDELPSGWADALPNPTPEDKGKATRLHSQDCLNALASVIPGNFLGASIIYWTQTYQHKTNHETSSSAGATPLSS